MNLLKPVFLLHLFFSLQYNLIAQVTNNKTIGTSTDWFERVEKLRAYKDGYLALFSTSFAIDGDKTSPRYGQGDLWLVQLDAQLNIIHQLTFGGNLDESTTTTMFNSMVIDSVDNIYITCTSSSNPSGNKTVPRLNPNQSYDIWMIKLDSNLNFVWQKTFGGMENDQSPNLFWHKNQLISTSNFWYFDPSSMGTRTLPFDGHYVDNYIFWIDPNTRSILKEKSIKTNDINYISQVNWGDEYHLLGFSTTAGDSLDKNSANYGESDVWIIKTDSNLNIINQTSFGGTGYDDLVDFVQVEEKIYLLVSSESEISGNKTAPRFGATDIWLICMDTNFNELWQKSLGGLDNDYAKAIHYDENRNNIYIGGQSNSLAYADKTIDPNGYDDIWIIEIASDGTIQNQYGYGGDDEERFVGFTQNKGQMILTTISRSNAGYGKSENSRGGWDAWFIEVDYALSVGETPELSKTEVYPNPTQYQFQLKDIAQPTHYQITDITGKIIKQGIYHPNTSIDIADLTKGLYLVKIEGYELQELVIQ